MASFIPTNDNINNYQHYPTCETYGGDLSRPSSPLSSSANNPTQHNSTLPKLPTNVNLHKVGFKRDDEKKTSSTSSSSSTSKEYESTLIRRTQFPSISLKSSQPRHQSNRHITTIPKSIKDISSTSSTANHPATPKYSFTAFPISSNIISNLSKDSSITGKTNNSILGKNKVGDYKWTFLLGSNYKDDLIYFSFRFSKSNKDSCTEVFHQFQFIAFVGEETRFNATSDKLQTVFAHGTTQLATISGLQQIVNISKLPQCYILGLVYMGRSLEDLL